MDEYFESMSIEYLIEHFQPEEEQRVNVVGIVSRKILFTSRALNAWWSRSTSVCNCTRRIDCRWRFCNSFSSSINFFSNNSRRWHSRWCLALDEISIYKSIRRLINRNLNYSPSIAKLVARRPSIVVPVHRFSSVYYEELEWVQLWQGFVRHFSFLLPYLHHVLESCPSQVSSETNETLICIRIHICL